MVTSSTWTTVDDTNGCSLEATALPMNHCRVCVKRLPFIESTIKYITKKSGLSTELVCVFVFVDEVTHIARYWMVRFCNYSHSEQLVNVFCKCNLCLCLFVCVFAVLTVIVNIQCFQNNQQQSCLGEEKNERRKLNYKWLG